MPRYVSQQQAAKHFQITDRTIRRWMGEGYITGYRAGPKRVLVDLDEVERFLARTPSTKARDGRKVYGPKSRIVVLPNRPEVVERPETDR